MAVSINSSSSITVSWSPPVGGADGYVILYSTDDEKDYDMTQLVEGVCQTSSLLSEGQLYTIRVLAYKDLPSLLSDPVLVRIDGQLCTMLPGILMIPLTQLTFQFHFLSLHYCCNY